MNLVNRIWLCTIAAVLLASAAHAQQPLIRAKLGAPVAATQPAQTAPRTIGYGETAPPITQEPIKQQDVMPIDLPTVLKLTSADNPTIGLAQARLKEAYARLDQARVLWLPDLTTGGSYLRHDGRIQAVAGDVFDTSKSSLFAGGGAQMRFDLSNALYAPLIARRLVDAEAARAQAVNNNVQLDAVYAYLDLLSLHAGLAVNADTLARAEQMLERAKAADKLGLSKTRADINRAGTEVNLRKEERIVLQGRAAAASARLVRILFLDPTVELVPAEPQVVPLTLLPPSLSIQQLVTLGLSQRPEMASAGALADAEAGRLRQAQVGPLLPKVQVDYLAGTFGGGINNFVGTFGARGDGVVSAYWELKNLGFGYGAQVRAERALLEQANYRRMEVQAQVAAEISESAKVAGSRFQALDNAQQAVKEATEMYRKLLETSFGMIGPRPQYDAVEPLLAIQALNEARRRYLDEVIEFNRAQFRLYTALGRPALCALPDATATPLAVPVIPPPATETLPKPRKQ